MECSIEVPTSIPLVGIGLSGKQNVINGNFDICAGIVVGQTEPASISGWKIEGGLKGKLLVCVGGNWKTIAGAANGSNEATWTQQMIASSTSNSTSVSTNTMQRLVWTDSNSGTTFELTSSGWVEKDYTGEALPYSYEVSGQTADYIELHDEERGVKWRLYKDTLYFRRDHWEPDAEFEFSCYGGWVS